MCRQYGYRFRPPGPSTRCKPCRRARRSRRSGPACRCGCRRSRSPAPRIRSRPLCPGEQHRPGQVEDGRAIIRTQAQRPARTCCSPRALEREPFAGGESLRGATTRLAARGREKKSGAHQPSTPRQLERMLLGNHFPLSSNRTTILLLILITWLSGRLNRRRKIVLIDPPAVAIIDQLFERLCDGEHL